MPSCVFLFCWISIVVCMSINAWRLFRSLCYLFDPQEFHDIDVTSMLNFCFHPSGKLLKWLILQQFVDIRAVWGGWMWKGALIDIMAIDETDESIVSLCEVIMVFVYFHLVLFWPYIMHCNLGNGSINFFSDPNIPCCRLCSSLCAWCMHLHSWCPLCGYGWY